MNETLALLFKTCAEFKILEEEKAQPFFKALNKARHEYTEETKEGFVLGNINSRVNSLLHQHDTRLHAINCTIKKLEKDLLVVMKNLELESVSDKESTLIHDLYKYAARPYETRNTRAFAGLLQVFYMLYNYDIKTESLRHLMDVIHKRFTVDLKHYKKATDELNAYVNNMRIVYERYTD